MGVIEKQRITALQTLLREAGIDYYIVPTADYHNSEYVSDYFKMREFLSGFTGSAGTLVVSGKEAGLWTDGRYFVQAESELEGSGIVLYRMHEENVPTIKEYLEKNVEEGQTIGFDGRVVDAFFGKELEEAFGGKNVTLAYDRDIAVQLWQDRPAMPVSRIWVVPEESCGMGVTEKLGKVRERWRRKALHICCSRSLMISCGSAISARMMWSVTRWRCPMHLFRGRRRCCLSSLRR